MSNRPGYYGQVPGAAGIGGNNLSIMINVPSSNINSQAFAAMPMPTPNIIPVIAPGHIQSGYRPVHPQIYHLPHVRAQMPAFQHRTVSSGDQQRWYEEQCKLVEKQRKERNYQMQQQRLRDFNSGSHKLDADTIIESMIGKIEKPRQQHQQPQQLKGVPDTGYARNLTQSELQSSGKARDWQNVSDLHGCFAPSIGLPRWNAVPEIYHVIERAVTIGSSININLLYPILLSSGLSREVLGHIWNLANFVTPGRITQKELHTLLALVAVAQSGKQFMSLDVLRDLTEAPVPMFYNTNNSGIAEETPVANVNSGEHMEYSGANVPPTTENSALPEINSVPVLQRENISSNDTIANDSNYDNDFDDFKSASISVEPTPAVNTISITRNATFHSATITSKITSTILPTSSIGSRLANYSSAVIPPKSPSPPSFSVEKLLLGSPLKDTSVDDDFADFQQASISQSSKVAATMTTGASENVVKPVSSVPGTSKFINANLAKDLMNTHDDKYSVFRQMSSSSLMEEIPNEDEDGGDDFGEFLSVPSSSPAPFVNNTENFVVANLNVNLNSVAVGSAHGSSNDALGFSKQFEINLFEDNSSNNTNMIFHQDIPISKPPPASASSASPMIMNLFPSSSASSAMVAPPPDNFEDQLKDSSVDDFGDFKSCDIVNSLNTNFGALAVKDNLSVESQSVSSLELGSWDIVAPSEYCIQTGERAGSLPSLELKISGGSEQEDDTEMSPTTIEKFDHPVIPSAATEHILPWVDKYSVINDEINQNKDSPTNEWEQCLQSGFELISSAVKTLFNVKDSHIVQEILASDEGSDYIKNIIEVYRVACRISQSMKSAALQSENLNKVERNVQNEWSKLEKFLFGTSLLPTRESLDFSDGILNFDSENLSIACGVCLLNVTAKSKASDNDVDTYKLLYGGRHYHTPCANFWVNCIDSLLPATPFPHPSLL